METSKGRIHKYVLLRVKMRNLNWKHFVIIINPEWNGSTCLFFSHSDTKVSNIRSISMWIVLFRAQIVTSNICLHYKTRMKEKTQSKADVEERKKLFGFVLLNVFYIVVDLLFFGSTFLFIFSCKKRSEQASNLIVLMSFQEI